MDINNNLPLAARTDGLAGRLRLLAQGRDALDVAQFQFIDLDGIRSAYGDRWPIEKARIRGIAEGFLRRRMGGSDLLINAGDGFVVVFGAAVGVEAEVAAGQLSHGLNEFFLGDVGVSPVPRFSATSHSAPVKELVTSLGDVDFTTAEPGVEPIESFGLPELDWRFQPVWDVKREILSNWYVTPYLKQTQRRLPGYQFESVTARPQEFVAVDEAGLWVSERAIQELIEQGKQAVIGVSIHAGSLTNDAVRSRILAALDRLDQQFVRYRVIKVAGVIPGFPRLYLKQIVEALRARTPNVVIGAAWDEPDIAGLLHIGAVAVGATLPASVLEPTSSVSLQSVAAKLRADISRAHLAKTRFFVEGAIPASLARMMSALGVDNIASSRIWPTTETPDAMLRWPASGLVA